MAQLSYSICMSLLHSLWQAGVIILLYRLLEISLREQFTPLQKKNFLFISLGFQIVLCCCTFFIYYFDASNNLVNNNLTKAVHTLLSDSTVHAVTPWLFSFYMLVIAYKITRTIYSWYTFRQLFHAGIQKPPVDLKLFTAVKAAHFGITRKVQLWLSNTISTPLTFGFFKPVIILPVALVNQLSIQQAEALVLHELTHIKANDYFLNWFLLVAENLFFFNPFILSLCAKIRLEREKYCDINVMAFDYPPLAYAQTLLQAQHIKKYAAQYQVAAVGKKQELLHRIHFFTNKKNHIRNSNHRLLLPLLSSLLVILFAATLFLQYSLIRTAAPVVTITTVPAQIKPGSESAGTAFVNEVIDKLTEDKLKNIAAIVTKQQPVIEKQIKKLAPLIKAIEDNAAAMAEDMADNIIYPVSIQENDAGRQIIISEEQSGSKNATVKLYTLSFVNGKWVLQPQWKLAAKELLFPDSLRNNTDSSAAQDQPIAY